MYKKHDHFSDTLGHLENNERSKLLKQAKKFRKAARDRGIRMPASIDDIVKELAGTPTSSQHIEKSGAVVWAGPKTVRLDAHDTEVELDGLRAVVGDMVGIQRYGEGWRVAKIEERRTKLGRPDVDNPNLERPVVANADAIIIVVSLKSPPLHPRLIDRYLIAIQAGGAEPVICVNKIDLMDGQERELELAKLEPYKKIPIRLFGISAESMEGVDGLRDFLTGKVCAFVGHSGVGKSSTIKALYPDLELRIQSLMKGYGRGAHTTTASTMYDLGAGTRLIDTPGVRSFGLWKMTQEELASYFPEFERTKCRFRDCSHRQEPGCGVRDAVEAGILESARYETYGRLYAEVIGN